MTAMHAANAINQVAKRLKATDRCDANCNAQAYVEVGMRTEYGDPVSLMFCAHHYKKYQPKLERLADEIVDERYLLELGETNRNGGNA